MNTINASKGADKVAHIQQALAKKWIRLIWRICQFKSITAGSLIALMGISTVQPGYAEQTLQVRALSSRPDMVSGGEVLVEASAPGIHNWHAHLNGHDVTTFFHPAEGSGDPLALVTGLNLGTNRLEIRVGGQVRSILELLNHPLTGSMFSGPHPKPFICQTEALGLGPTL